MVDGPQICEFAQEWTRVLGQRVKESALDYIEEDTGEGPNSDNTDSEDSDVTVTKIHDRSHIFVGPHFPNLPGNMEHDIP